jgi:hypothetical protein
MYVVFLHRAALFSLALYSSLTGNSARVAKLFLVYFKFFFDVAVTRLTLVTLQAHDRAQG